MIVVSDGSAIIATILFKKCAYSKTTCGSWNFVQQDKIYNLTFFQWNEFGPSADLTAGLGSVRVTWDHDWALNGQRSWCRDIKEILHKCGMVDQFEQQHWHQDSVSETYRSVVTCLGRLEQQQQSRDDQTVSRLRIYKTFSMSSGQMNPVVVPYFRLDWGSRTLIAKPRTGTLPLSIETGRYRQIALDQRVCSSCDRNSIEDEIHFIFYCEKYNGIRNYLSRSCRNANICV